MDFSTQPPLIKPALSYKGALPLRALVALAALVIAATGVTPFDLTGVDIGADHIGELTLTIVVLVGMFFVLE